MGSDKRARDADRNLAIEFVQNAWVDGQLRRDEHEQRVERVLRASTVADIEREVRDLQGPGGAVWRPAVPPLAAPAPLVQHPTPPPAVTPTQAEADAALVRRARTLIVAAAVGVVGLVTLGNALTADDEVVAQSYAWSWVDPATVAEAVEARFGTTEVYSATFGGNGFDDANLVTVVVPTGDPGRAYAAEWDSNLDEWSEPTERRAEGEPVDLDDVAVDPWTIEAEASSALELVEGVTVEVRAGTHQGRSVCLTATAGGDGPDVVLRYDCDGNRV